ncbi:Beauvericin nonribosomal cyclodepsipeptide synthetase BEA1 [Fusarium oxysporum f. sp. rapae]|uniref:Beauvericin nonribosomal cyclodepsipeptide synthetase BEA1 n=1 Tax=Fusarium oxysporum f. sp. rapae TaxID=485398 RepID=A0A8J5NJW0_FUSOX|nr:Beauvericin nonribosomal cyclodepsipeptide synthetase BEA1 [Fusarium oxysporum f. sp. rapae]
MTSLNTKSGSAQPVMPLLLPSDYASHTDTLVEEVSRHLALGRDRIENILPSTAFQQDVIDCAGGDKQRSIGHVAYEISNDIDISNLAAAWKDTINRTPTLRTCAFTSSSGDSYQVVLKDSFVFSWMFCTSVDQKDAVVQDEAAAAASGPRCNRFVLLDDPIAKKKLLIWTFSHAVVDSTFQERILGRVLKAYKHGHDDLSNRPYTPESSDPEDEGLSLTPTDGSKTPETGGIHPATQFWKEYLSDLNASAFPHLTSPLAVPYPNAKSEHHIAFTRLAPSTWSSIGECRAALAILLSRYTHSPEALFGVVTDQQHLIANGPTRTIVPFRVHCASDQSISDIIGAVNADGDSIRQFADIGLRSIASVGEDGSAACVFQTVLLVTDRGTDQSSSCEIHHKIEESELFMPCTNRALLLHCQMASDGVSIIARYDKSLIDSQQMARLLRQLGHLIQVLGDSTDNPMSLGELDMITQEDQTEIQSWNAHPIPSQPTLIHKEMLKTSSISPTKAAICAWDGEWTYSQLDSITSRLAALIKFSTPDQEHAILPIYFEKSKWVVASMLAVMKAGHAFTLIDPNDPPARVSQVVGQTGATVALTSKLYSSKVQGIVGRCIVVDDDLVQSLICTCAFNPDLVLATVTPEDLAYVIFTSGSTGDPKGIMIEHRAFSSCALKFGSALGINSDTRALQFGSHAFGACLLEIMTTLIHGGCVCIPSDDDRMNNVPAFINRANVNWMMATPSYMGTFQPEDVPGLQTLVLVGEQMSPSVNAIWAPRVQLLDGYGQSESSSICFVGNIGSSVADPNNIGHSVGAHSWIIDPSDPNRLVPIGAIGELVIESPGIARDYIIPPPTEKSPFFLTVPAWYPSKQLPNGLKFYRTGDLARYASDGTVVCLGRMDSQVKIRGQRVELGAVETHLRQQLADDMSIVVEAVKLSDSPTSTVLVAFLIASQATQSVGDATILDLAATKDMSAKLKQVLPRHSIPSAYISMQHLPRTATGKVDRRKLRSIGRDILAQQIQGISSRPSQLSSPTTSRQSKLDEVWCQCLGLEPGAPNIGSTFFELGGHSITAIKMVNMARSAGIELKVSDIYQNPTLAGLEAIVNGSAVPYSLIPTTTRDGPVEQSYSQGRLWFLDQLEVGALWYLIPYAVRMRGLVDIDALSRALMALEQRHETLRTTFEDHDGAGVQVIHQTLSKKLRVVDATDSDYLRLLEQEQTTPFDLTSEAGWRALLIRLSDTDYVLSIVMHHIVSDGWSIDVLRHDLSQLYAAALQGRDPLSAMNPLPIQYSDFAMWQKQEAQALEHEKQLDYWKKQLADCSPAKLSTDFPRPALLSGEAGVVPVSIDGQLYQNLREFCNENNTTSFAVLLAAFRAAHYRLTGVDDAVIGTPIANRNRWELENIIGFFVNTQCMRITVDDEDTFNSLVRQVRATTTAAFENEDVPFERVVSTMLPGSRDLSRTPLAQLIFAVHSQKDLGRFELQGLESEAVASKAYTRFDIEFHLFQEADGLKGSCNFATDLFKPETVENVVSVFFQILRNGLEKPQVPISVLPLTDGIEELRRLDLLRIKKVEYPRDASLVDIFRTQVAAYPDSFAVVDSSSRLTYAELDRQSDLLATWLRRRCMPAETLVGVLAPRSCEAIVAIIGILKANLAYLPFDVKSPSARLNDILSGLPGPTIVLLGSDVPVPELQVPDLEFVRVADAVEYCDTNDLNNQAYIDTSNPSGSSLAYVLFTSGSTGRPKGVMVEHRVIVRLMRSNIIPDFPTQPRSAHMFNIAFDGATYEIFFTLLNGGTLVCIDYMTTLDVKALQDVFIKEQINAACMAPALLKLYLTDARDALRGLDFLMAAGDRFDGQDAIEAQSLVRGQCYNGYGPTENGIMSTRYPITAGDSFINGVPIGRAVNNSGAYVTDPNQQLVGVGVMGELVVTGDGLARGYFDPALNKNRFIHIEVDGQRVRAYRTGDRVRYRVGDGLIEFFGRMDTQFKIRGNRIESAEVEAAMLSHGSVRDAAIVVQKDDGEKADLVGFVVIDHDHSLEGDANDNQVEGWQDHFETEMYADIGDIDPSTIGKDFKGWTSMYDGSEIDKAEMQEWLDDTIKTLRDGQAPGHVLEVGTGSGMILFNLGDGLQSYRGLEPSKSAAAFTNSVIKSVPSLAGKAEVHVGTAQDISQLIDLHPELVVINSVAQYFPSPEYLAQVADTLVHLPGVKRLFFGDMRTNATNKHFLAARAVRTLGDNATKDGVRQKMAELEEREEELLVEPAFFTALQDRFPDLVHHVEILPKNMHATNELSAYRYAAVVHIRDHDSVPVHAVEKGAWVDFGASRMDRTSLSHFLRRSKDSATVAISNIPFAKTAFERQVVESLEAEDESKLDGAAWISAIRPDAESRASLSVPDLDQLAKESGFRLEVSAARQWSQRGALDAVFHHLPSPSDTRRTLIKFPTDNHIRSSATLANRPLQGLQRRRAALQVRERLQSLLPSYMVPSSIVVLDQMPLNPNGKVDRKELARQARIVPKQQTAPLAQAVPISDIEAILCDEATATFGMKVDISDDFFKLGGHSLLATKLISRVEQRFNVRVTVKDVFDNPVFVHLAVVIREGLASRTTFNNGQDKQGWSARVAPRTETEIILCDEASKLLGIEVGITDNFFDLGGHSMMATKLAMRLGRRLDTTIVVKDIFDYPVLFQLSKKLESAGTDTGNKEVQVDDYSPFELLSLEDPRDFIQREICSQLNISFESIQDTYQSTQMQKSFLFSPGTGSPRPLTPFYIDFPVDSDPATLVNACHSLVQHIDMFRTVFVLASGQLYQVVLKHLDVPIETIVTNQNVNTATNDFLDEHAQDPIRLGESLIRIAILKQSSSVRVLLRLSHALYDGLSLEPIVRNLHILFNGMSLLPPTQFRRYMEYTANSQEKGFEFWRDVIGESPMTVLSDTSNVVCRQEVAPSKALHLSKVVSVPSQAIRSSIATQATVFNSACALVLSKESGSSDVVFGRIVSGRQGLPVNCQDIIGPCTNAVPVRAHIGADENHHQMLRDMQDQYLRSLPFETLGFEEIKRNCTGWPEATTNFACCVTYHNFEYHPESEVEQQRVEMGVLSKHVELRKDEPLYDLAIAGEVEPDGMSLKITIIARAHLFEEERVQYFLEEVCNTFQTLNFSL